MQETLIKDIDDIMVDQVQLEHVEQQPKKLVKKRKVLEPEIIRQQVPVKIEQKILPTSSDSKDRVMTKASPNIKVKKMSAQSKTPVPQFQLLQTEITISPDIKVQKFDERTAKEEIIKKMLDESKAEESKLEQEILKQMEQRHSEKKKSAEKEVRQAVMQIEIFPIQKPSTA
jgi:hypothetical protein